MAKTTHKSAPKKVAVSQSTFLKSQGLCQIVLFQKSKPQGICQIVLFQKACGKTRFWDCGFYLAPYNLWGLHPFASPRAECLLNA